MAGEQPYTILIVDDNVELLDILTDILRDIGHFQVISATDGAAGLAQFAAHQPDCVVIDVMMPRLNGYQLAQALRGDPASAATPLVMLTALAQERDQFAGLATGADQYLIKPVKPQELIAAIQRALTLTEADRAAQLRRLAEEGRV